MTPLHEVIINKNTKGESNMDNETSWKIPTRI
jgi:hypothetical protein